MVAPNLSTFMSNEFETRKAGEYLFQLRHVPEVLGVPSTKSHHGDVILPTSWPQVRLGLDILMANQTVGLWVKLILYRIAVGITQTA